MGRLQKSYEPFAEGYLNCIRILKQKGDRFFTIQYYYDFIAASEELGELHSVAELYREAGEYARRVGFIYADYFMTEAAQAWLRVGKMASERSQAAELIENALLAAVSCFNRVQDDRNVADCYGRLATLDLSDKKKARYQELATDLGRLSAGRDRDAPPAFPEYFRRRLPVQEVWVRDLLEQESGSDIPDAIGRLIGDHKNVWEVQRRKALLIALALLTPAAACGGTCRCKRQPRTARCDAPSARRATPGSRTRLHPAGRSEGALGARGQWQRGSARPDNHAAAARAFLCGGSLAGGGCYCGRVGRSSQSNGSRRAV